MENVVDINGQPLAVGDHILYYGEIFVIVGSRMGHGGYYRGQARDTLFLQCKSIVDRRGTPRKCKLRRLKVHIISPIRVTKLTAVKVQEILMAELVKYNRKKQVLENLIPGSAISTGAGEVRV